MTELYPVAVGGKASRGYEYERHDARTRKAAQTADRFGGLPFGKTGHCGRRMAAVFYCWKYGFILRFPENKTDITDVIFESGIAAASEDEAAKAICEPGICIGWMDRASGRIDFLRIWM